jgi:hypothetical protein
MIRRALALKILIFSRLASVECFIKVASPLFRLTIAESQSSLNQGFCRIFILPQVFGIVLMAMSSRFVVNWLNGSSDWVITECCRLMEQSF